MIFFDTSVLIAAIQVGHTHHQPSRKLFHILGENKAATSVHALAEVYATLTRMTLGLRLSPFDTINAIEALLKKLTPVALSPEEYLTTLRITAKLGHSSGMIYDALHLACAYKIEAEHIYTWNVKHFRSLAPDLADRIITP